MSSILLAHPTGNENVRAAARAFVNVGWLKQFYSCICWNLDSPLNDLLPASLVVQLRRRSFADIPYEYQFSHPLRETFRLLSSQNSLLSRREYGFFSVDAIYRSLDRYVAAQLLRSEALSAVYAYEDGALHTFRAAHRLGIKKIYELPIGYWRAAQQIFKEERELNPEWACTLPGLHDSPDKLARKEEELHLADRVIVASSFVRSTLVDYQKCTSLIEVVPYGAPPPVARNFDFVRKAPLKVLIVGSLSQRKGISYALDAIEPLGDQVSLTMIGRAVSADCVPLIAAIDKYRWFESLPHSEILRQMKNHDILLFPTLFDGFGLVIAEALSQGLPVISTPNSGAPECIRHGVEGFIVPIRDSQAITLHLQQLLDNPDQLASMQQACLRRAAELSWTEYEKALRVCVGQIFSKDLNHVHK